MEDNLKKKMEDDLKKKRKTNQSTKINVIGCDTIVNSPSFNFICRHSYLMNIPCRKLIILIYNQQA